MDPVRATPFGPSGARYPVVGQGTYQLEQFDRAEVMRSLDRGIELGLTHLDTAYEYGLGRVESEIVAPLLVGRRDRVQVTSKILPAVSSRDRAIEACEATLRRLGTDYLDLMLLHWWERHRPLEETIEAFERLVEQGKLRAWGLSNLDLPELQHAVALAGPGRVAANEVIYNLRMRHIEHRLLDWCRAQRIAVIGYSPFGCHSTPGHLFPETQRLGGGVLESIAEAYGATPRAVALAFLTRAEGVVVIPKAERVAFVEDNARAGALVLRDEDIARIDAAYPVPTELDVPWCDGTG
jgi:diketogulonate reductase-like aldo/keto reductase